MSTASPIPPIAAPVNPALPPRFHEMGEYYFQDFCRELWLQERGVADCHHYGTRGQAQLGIDLLAYGQPGEPNRAGQCKCYETLSASDVRSAVAKFLEHIQHWQKEGITDFTLFLACAADDRKVVDEIGEQRRVLAAHNIAFHVCDAGQLRNKVRPHPAIAATYCTEAWVPFLCGGGPTGAAAIGASAMLQVVGTVVDDLSAARSELLDEVRQHLRSGHEEVATRRLSALRSSSSWLHLPPALKGRAFRLMASASIATNHDLDRATAYVAEAKLADPNGDFQVIDALLIYFREGAQQALSALGKPVTADARNLQLALLVAQGRPTEVLAIVEQAQFAPDAETHRLHALALLLERRVAEARQAIAKSAALHAEWTLVRLADATINYAASIDPSFQAWQHLDWPVPPDLSLVKRDADSVILLRHAAAEFDGLLAQEPAGGSNRAIFETWKLACLANDAEQQPAAAAFARSLLDTHPTHYRAAIWALERGYPFDSERVRAALEDLVNTPDCPLDIILALASLNAVRGDLAGAEAVLDTHKARFTDDSAKTVWRFMMAQFASARGSSEEARALVMQESDGRQRQRGEAMLLRQEALRSGNIKPLAEFLEAVQQQSEDPFDLLECCEAKLDAGEPGFVADRAERLVHDLPTPHALHVALLAAARARKPQLGMDLLERYSGVLGDGPLPAGFWRLRVEFLNQLGLLPDAAQEAELLATQHADWRNLFAQFSAQFALGDLRACAHTARILLAYPDVPPMQLLQMAAHVASQDQPLAVSLWDAAFKKNVTEPEVIMLAVDLGFRLGLDERLAPLLAHLPRLATEGEAGMRMLRIEEIFDHMRGRSERLREVNEHYNAGRLPMHMCAAEAHHPLADIYHLQLEKNERAETLLGSAPLLARHGAKPVDTEVVLQPGKIYADITAILLAAHFELLDQVEREFGPIRISARLPQSLISQLHQVENGQPALEPGKQALLEFVDQGKVIGIEAPTPLVQRDDDVGAKMGARWCSWLQRMQEAGGFLVDHFPLTSNDTRMTLITLPEHDSLHVLSIGELLAALARAGAITPEAQRASAAVFGNEALVPGRDVPLDPETPIFLESGIAEQLARAGILEALSKNRRVETDQAALDRVRAELRAQTASKRLAEWLRRLLDRLQSGLRTGTYVAFAPTVRRATEVPFLENPDCATFEDMFDPSAADGGVVWCDDRFLNGFNRCEAGPLVGISELLLGLRRRDAIDEPRYYAMLLRLRAANVRYLPLTAEELVHHLRRAPIQNGRVVETAALGVLRRSLAIALLDEQRLQAPGREQAAAGHLAELTWIQSLNVAVIGGITQLWRDDALPDAEARSDWLLEFIHFDTRLVAERILKSEGDPARSVAANIAQHFIAGFTLQSESPLKPVDPASRRVRYFRWLYEVLLAQHTLANPEILPLVGDMLTSTLADPVWAQFDGKSERKAAQLYLYGIAADVPKEMQSVVQLPDQLLAELDATILERRVVRAGGHSFDYASWWQAAAAAFNGQPTDIEDLGGGKFSVRRAEQGLSVEGVASTTGETGDTSFVGHPLVGLLVDSADERQSFLAQHPELFDCASDRRRDGIEQLAEITDPAARMLAAEEWQRRSAEWFYSSLATRLHRHEDMTVSDFIPSAEGLRDHLRLVVNGRPAWEETARQLITEEGCLSALTRLASVPVSLPDALLQTVLEMSAGDREKLLAQAEAKLLTVVARLHLAHVFAFCADVEVGYLSRAQGLVTGVLTADARTAWAGFHALLKWSFLQLRQLPATDRWSAAERLSLAWVHAARTHNELLAARADPKVIQSHFEAAYLFLKRNPLLPEPSLHDDVCSPARVTFPRIVSRALGTMFLSLPAEVCDALRPTNADWLGTDEATRQRSWADIGVAAAPRPDVLHSWLGGQSSTLQIALFGKDMVDRLFGPGVEAAAQTTVQMLEKDAADVSAWRLLFNTLFDGPAPADIAERLAALVRQLDFRGVFRTLGEECGITLIIASAAARFSKDDELIRRVTEHLVIVAGDAAARREFQGISKEAEHQRQNFGASLRYAAENLLVSEDATVASLAYQLLTDIVRSWPSMGTLMRQNCGGQIPTERLAHVRGAWPLFLALRAAP